MDNELRSAAVQALQASPMFAALREDEVRSLVDRCSVVRCRAGRQLFSPSEVADRFYVVLVGAAKVYMLSARGDEQILHICGPGQAFAEAAALTKMHYPAHAEATEPSALLVVTRAVLLAAIRETPDLALELLAGLAGKLREFRHLIEDLSLKEVPARVARVLMAEHRRTGARTVRLTETKRQLAARIGTIAETLSRALRKMSKAGLIDVRGSEIELLDLPGLEQLVLEGR